MTATVDVSKRGKEDNSVEGSNKVEETKGCDPSRPETLIDAEKGWFFLFFLHAAFVQKKYLFYSKNKRLLPLVKNHVTINLQIFS